MTSLTKVDLLFRIFEVRMKTLLIIIISTSLFSSLSSCVIVADGHDGRENWREEQSTNREQINGLELQSSRSMVTERLGPPSFSEAFTVGDNEYRILSYRTQHAHSDGMTSKDETTPLVFKNGRLIGWGEGLVASIREF